VVHKVHFCQTLEFEGADDDNSTKLSKTLFHNEVTAINEVGLRSGGSITNFVHRHEYGLRFDVRQRCEDLRPGMES
jgi:hypothetical protein